MNFITPNIASSNNTNKLSPQEQGACSARHSWRSNNTNKLSPQERVQNLNQAATSSNNTNKLSPQEQCVKLFFGVWVQIIQINLVLKNTTS